VVRSRGALAAVVLATAAALPRDPEEVLPRIRVPATGLMSQEDHASGVACGPTSLLNGLVCEGERGRAAFAALPGDGALAKLAGTIARHGGEPSGVYLRGERWRPRSGVANLDLLAWARELRAELALPKVDGLWLDRVRGEADEDFLRRVHTALATSLRAGVAPVTKLRSWSPGTTAEGGFEWNGRAGHWVLVTEVPATLTAHARGFVFTYVDPATGRQHEGYVAVERQRPFLAAKGDEVNWYWVEDQAFLTVTAPDCAELALADVPWHLRTNVLLDYTIGVLR